MLLVHGDDDRNVQFSQTTGLVQLLRAHNVYHELIVLPDDTHETMLYSRWQTTYAKIEDFLRRADGIQVNAILPGWIDTDLTQRAREQIDGLHDKVLARTPAARWGDIADFAGIAVFLSSSASDFVTGTAIPVDGGFSIMG